jgi:tripeptide aminopeptidase
MSPVCATVRDRARVGAPASAHRSARASVDVATGRGRWRVAAPLALLLAAGPVGAAAQSCDAALDAYCGEVRRIAARPDVQRAMAHIEASDGEAVAWLIELTQIPAPPFGEAARGRRYAELLRDAGADSVWTDVVGNVVALRRGTERGRRVALSGHLDTVFPEGTDVRVRQAGDTLLAPGIGDDTRGLVVVLQVLRSLAAAGIRTPDDLLFIGTVGEEGLGDLRGVKQLFGGGPRIDAFITVDGGSDAAVTHQALGSVRYRITATGPGGHSWGDFGVPTPIHVLAGLIARFEAAAVPIVATGPRSSFNVGRIGGGTSVNAVASEAWAELDLRSIDPRQLLRLDSALLATGEAVRAATPPDRRGRTVTLTFDRVGERPSAEISRDTPLVRRAAAATRLLGLEPAFGRASTDANVPISLGIPAIAIGRGGEGGGAHTPAEWWLNRDGTRAIRKALLILLAESGVR